MTSSKSRLLDAGLRLFALRGFEAVTVGDIEAEAGFVARGGTLYRHFKSKGDLLDAAMRRHIDSLGEYDALLHLLPLPDLASELRLVARWMLERLDREEAISRIVEKEGDRLQHLIDSMREGLSDSGYRLASAYLGQHIETGDTDAMAVILLGSLINLRRSKWTFGAPPIGINDERAIDAWVALCLAAITTSKSLAMTKSRRPAGSALDTGAAREM